MTENFPNVGQRTQYMPIFREILRQGGDIEEVLYDVQSTGALLSTGPQADIQTNLNSLSERALGRSGVQDPGLERAMAEIDTLAAANGGMVRLTSSSLTSIMGNAGARVNATGASASVEISASWSRATIDVSPVQLRMLARAAHDMNNNVPGASDRFTAISNTFEQLGVQLTAVTNRLPNTPLTGAAATAGAPVAPPPSGGASLSLGGTTITTGGTTPPPTTPPPAPGGKAQ